MRSLLKILNTGNLIVNTYLYPIDNGYVAVDTGYENSYPRFIKKLTRYGIKLSDIKYLFLTHAHDDHAGFLNELLKNAPSINVITSSKSIPILLKGQNSFLGGCSSYTALLFCNIMKLFGRGEHTFPPVEKRFLNRVSAITAENRPEFEKILHGKIINTPGHTEDSMSLLVNNEILFCGDAAMNGFPSLHKITIWIENKESFSDSWKYIISVNPKRIYPSHGKPFEVSALKNNISHINKIKLYTLKHKT